MLINNNYLNSWPVNQSRHNTESINPSIIKRRKGVSCCLRVWQQAVLDEEEVNSELQVQFHTLSFGGLPSE